MTEELKANMQEQCGENNEIFVGAVVVVVVVAWESEEAKREKYQQLYNDRSRDGIMRQNVERKNAFSVFFIQTPFPFGKREKSGTQKPFSSLKEKLFRSILMKTTS